MSVHGGHMSVRGSGYSANSYLTGWDDELFEWSGMACRSKISLTMQTQSTPSNHPPGCDSFFTRSSRPSLPLSSIPSKQHLKFTGNSLLFWKWYCSTLSQPSTGPLSSDDPRPISLPSSWIARVNGSVSHPSDLFA